MLLTFLLPCVTAFTLSLRLSFSLTPSQDGQKDARMWDVALLPSKSTQKQPLAWAITTEIPLATLVHPFTLSPRDLSLSLSLSLCALVRYGNSHGGMGR